MTQPAAQLALIADQLRALANNGLLFTEDVYQIERFHTVLNLAAQLQAMIDVRPPAEIARIFQDDLTLRTPLAVVDTAVFDKAGRLLLIQRADNGLWALPGGACDVGEAPATGGVREVWEESGYQAEPTALLGVFDSRLCGQNSSRHLYHFLFAAKLTGGHAIIADETKDVAWFQPEQIPWSKLSPGHEPRIHFALAWQKFPAIAPFFDREALEFTPTLHHPRA
ncbi:MAG: NUDIX hydrolase N-terminal domain-containing protein [Caldilineaceae bacterium]|nr:NUDIX hydrolase N-terminal domain-containing protein [Caldilineaceae bacterium]